MIVANGTLQWRLSGGSASLDPETGYPVPEEETWSGPVPCQIVPVSADRLSRGSAGGERFTDRSFTVLLEEGAPVEAKALRLADRSGRELGVFPVKAYEPLEAVRQVRLTL